MSRRYRRNGTPIGRYKVYALATQKGTMGEEVIGLFVVEHRGIDTYEDLESLILMEELSGKFGYGYSRITLTQPGTNLYGADLSFLDLSECNLSNAILRGSVMEGARFIECSFRGADIFSSVLRRTVLDGSDLRGANLAGCIMDGCSLNFILYDSKTEWPSNFLPPKSRDGYMAQIYR